MAEMISKLWSFWPAPKALATYFYVVFDPHVGQKLHNLRIFSAFGRVIPIEAVQKNFLDSLYF
jgi:hypothetical protein